MHIDHTHLLRDLICLCLLFFCSLAIREYNIESRIYWEGDQARDLLISYQIRDHGAAPPVGALASGFQDNFHYPPQYYYFLDIVGRITRNPLTITAIFALLQSVYACILYLLGSRYAGRLAGFLTALMYVFSEWGIENSNLGSLYLAPIILFGGLALMRREGGIRNTLLNAAGLACIALSTTFHYSTAVIGGVCILYDFIRLAQNREWNQITWRYLFLLILCIGLYYPIVVFRGAASVWHYFSPAVNFDTTSSTMPTFLKHVQQSWQLFSGGRRFAGSLAALYGIGAIAAYIGQKTKQRTAAVYALCLTGIFLLVVSLKRGAALPSWNYITLYPLYAFFCATIVSALVSDTHRLIRWFGIVLMCFTLYATVNNFWVIRIPNTKYVENRQAARQITRDAERSGNPSDVYVTAHSPESGFGYDSFSLWYFFAMQNPRFLVYDQANHRLKQALTGVHTHYLVCETADRPLTKDCVRQFEEAHALAPSNMSPFIREPGYTIWKYRTGDGT